MSNDGRLAYELACSGDKSFASSEYAQDIDIVSQQGGKVAYGLAYNSYKTGWMTSEYDILKLCDGGVANWLHLNSMATNSKVADWYPDHEVRLLIENRLKDLERDIQLDKNKRLSET